MSKFGPKYEQNTQKMAVFCYRRIGRNGRIFGTEYSAGFGRIFGRIFGIRSFTSTYTITSIACLSTNQNDLMNIS